MSEMPDRELDRRIRDLVADAVSDAPAPPDASTFPQVSGRTNGRRGGRWGLFTAIGATAAAAAVAAFVVIPGLGDEAIREIDPADQPPVVTDPADQPEPTTPATTTPPVTGDTAPATTDPATAAPDTTTTPTQPPPPVVAEAICTGGLDAREAAELFTEAVVLARETGEFIAVSDCLDEIPEVYTGELPACWTVCEGDRVLDASLASYGEVGDFAGNWSWLTQIPVSTITNDGSLVDVIEAWRFVPGNDRHRVEDFELWPPIVERGPSLEVITRYFDLIAAGDWQAAARLLADGAVNWDERSDLAELDLDWDVATFDDLADALEQWCSDGCDTDPPTADELTLTGRYGITRNDRRIEAGWFEGTYSVVGLPIPIEGQAA